MFLFYRLLLAFLSADYPLQTDGIFRLRYAKRWGVFVHAGVHLAVTLLLCLPYLYDPLFIAAVIVLQVIHGLFDRFKKKGALGFIGDQLFHLATLGAVAWLFASLVPAGIFPAWLDRLWKDDYLVNLLSGLILATYTGMFLVNFGNHGLRKSFTQPLFSSYYRYSYLFCGLLVFCGVVLAIQLHPAYLVSALLPPAALAVIARRKADHGTVHGTESDGSYQGAFALDYLWCFIWAGGLAVLIALKLYP